MNEDRRPPGNEIDRGRAQIAGGMKRIHQALEGLDLSAAPSALQTEIHEIALALGRAGEFASGLEAVARERDQAEVVAAAALRARVGRRIGHAMAGCEALSESLGRDSFMQSLMRLRRLIDAVHGEAMLPVGCDPDEITADTMQFAVVDRLSTIIGDPDPRALRAVMRVAMDREPNTAERAFMGLLRQARADGGRAMVTGALVRAGAACAPELVTLERIGRTMRRDVDAVRHGPGATGPQGDRVVFHPGSETWSLGGRVAVDWPAARPVSVEELVEWASRVPELRRRRIPPDERAHNPA